MKQWRWAGLVVLVGAATLGGRGLQRWRDDRQMSIVEPSSTGHAAVLDRLHPFSVRLPASAAPSGAAAVPTSTEMEIPPEGLEACGVRRIPAEELRRWKADPALAEAQANAVDAAMQQIANAGVQTISARLAAGNERQQVAARLLMGDRDGAALLAARSTDALAYQMALSACAWGREAAPNCQRLNPRRWAELDPADARPWLRMVEDARQRKDEAGMDAALAEAAARPRLSRGTFLLEAQAVAVADAVPDAATFGQAVMAIAGTDGAILGFDMGTAFRTCKDEGGRDTRRREACRAVARLVLANTTDPGEATLAQKLAERLGVPREQQAYDGATLKAASERYYKHAMEDIGMDCATMRRYKQLSTERVASGELAMALALLKAR